MTLPNIFFEDFPIEFKEINPSDFPNFQAGEKQVISPNNDGYIDAELQSNINLLEKNTVVINAAVGQGKTYSIINIVKKFYENDGYLIFIASPFVSLVQQYFDKVKESGIPETEIYRYESIGTDLHLDAWNSKIQIVTVNCLLGNPGEDKLVSSEAKRNYINYLVEKCEEHNKKVVFIYDEIHDAIHNFKEEFIFNLWKWRNVIHKNIVLSATYNEASKIVLEYLAELTENKIQIIESVRIRYPEKLSDLYLWFNNAKAYRHTNDDICGLIHRLIQDGKRLDILCYSKALADNICKKTEEGIGAILLDAGISIQNCTADLESNQINYRETPDNRYDPDKCNIGTNFKTGVSIEKENHAYVIIIPPIAAKGQFKNRFGIFSGGINSVIQALARQRIKGEIHIILPPPDNFDYESLELTIQQKQAFIDFYEGVKSESIQTENVKYIPINSQEDLLSDYYNNILKANVIDQIEYIHSRSRVHNVRLEYPEYKLFKLEKGEKYLASEIKFFGKDLSAFITYCAITNQFVNCNFKGSNTKPTLIFQKGQIQYKLERYYNEYMDDEYFNSLYLLVSDKYKYHQFKKDLFDSYKIIYKEDETDYGKRINSCDEKEFETQLIAFLQRHFYRTNRDFVRRYNVNGIYIDSPFLRGEYFLSCISHANELAENLASDPQTLVLIEAYQSLDYFRQKAVRSIQTLHVNGQEVQYLPNFNREEPFIAATEEDRFTKMLNALTDRDYFIKNDIFSYRHKFFRIENRDDLIRQSKAFYKYIKTDFFKGYIKRINNLQIDDRVMIVEEISSVPHTDSVMDFISPASLNISLEHLPPMMW